MGIWLVCMTENNPTYQPKPYTDPMTNPRHDNAFNFTCNEADRSVVAQKGHWTFANGMLLLEHDNALESIRGNSRGRTNQKRTHEKRV